MNTPVKVVRIKLPEGHVDEDESSMSATPENTEQLSHLKNLKGITLWQ